MTTVYNLSTAFGLW